MISSALYTGGCNWLSLNSPNCFFDVVDFNSYNQCCVRRCIRLISQLFNCTVFLGKSSKNKFMQQFQMCLNWQARDFNERISASFSSLCTLSSGSIQSLAALVCQRAVFLTSDSLKKTKKNLSSNYSWQYINLHSIAQLMKEQIEDHQSESMLK